MSAKRNRKLEWVANYARYSPWANFLILVAVSAARTWWTTMPPYVLWTLSLVTGAWAILATWATATRDKLRAGGQLEDYLHSMAEAIEKTVPGGQIRVNVMTLDKKKGVLKVRWHAKMDSELERNLEWEVGQGCTGRAFETEQIQFSDLSQFQTVTSFEHLQGHDGHTPWSMSKGQWQLTRDLGSVVSVHIPSSRRPFKPIGVLNIDCNLPLAQSGLDTAQFLDQVTDWSLPIISSLMGDAGS